MAKKKKTPRQKLDKDCLDVWSLIIRLPQVCAICGKQQSDLSKVIFQGHHIISRSYWAGRFKLDNGVCLCMGCHWIDKIDSERFRDMILGAIGEDTYNDLKVRYMRTCKISTGELGLIYLGLKEELKALKKRRLKWK